MEDSLDGRERKIAHKSQENVQKRLKERKRHLNYLVHDYLKENSYNMAAQTVFETANLSNTVEVCDNVKLEDIYCDYLKQYELQYNHPPKITKTASVVEIPDKSKSGTVSLRPKFKVTRPKWDIQEKKPEFDISVTSLGVPNVQANQEKIVAEVPSRLNFNNFPPEWKEMSEMITQQIIPKTLGVKWSDCIGLDSAITLLKEAIVFPQKYPEFFSGVAPWKGILLYGTPGTGKTLLAKALACETDSVFFSVSASSFVSKWRGESEKLVKVLFEMAKQCKPCTIVIDEIEALVSKRDDQQHEASRRFKSELLCQMDGILTENDDIFILAMSNIPWEIDAAVLRRFEKKVFIDIPGLDGRIEMFRKYLQFTSENAYSIRDIVGFARQTENHTGNDIRLICKEAKMRVVRRQIANRIFLEEARIGKLEENVECQPTVMDVQDAILRARHSDYDVGKYIQWQAKFGGF